MNAFTVSHDEMSAVLVTDGETLRLKAVASETRWCTTCVAFSPVGECRISYAGAPPHCGEGWERKDRQNVVWEAAT